ncbi:MAG TPA: ABC transporter substrate-binding protein [Acidimicrobiales bacterium]|nr:ABC transporter substrate-binding protein [Acidimicrobiales bacterium]
MRARSVVPVALLASIAMFAVACGSNNNSNASPSTSTKSSEGKPVIGGTLTDLQNFSGASPDHLDPNRAASIQDSQPGQLIWSMLTHTNPKTGELENSVAESIDHNADFTQWTFHVKKGLKFSNGDPVLPSSFAFSWNRLVNPALASEVSYHVTDNLKIVGADDVAKGKAQTMSGLVADDNAMTLKMTLAEPLNFADKIVSHLAFAPLDVKDVTKNGTLTVDKTVDYEKGIMIGNGPYKMLEPAKPQDSVTLVRNDLYNGGPEKHKAYIDKIVFKEFNGESAQDTAWTTFESGGGDTGYIPSTRFAEAKAKYGPLNRISDKPFLGIYYWGFNMKDPVVGGAANVNLRKAIAAAINKTEMINKVYNGSRKVATGLTPPGIPGYKAGLDKIPNLNLTAAKKYLSDWETATGKKASSLDIKLNYGIGLGHADNAAIIQANLAAIGIKSTLDGRDGTTYFSTIRKNNPPGMFLRAGWVADYVAYDNMLFPLFDSAGIGADNLTQYDNPKFDQLIEQARSAKTQADAEAKYREAEDLVLNVDRAAVPLNWYAGQVVWSARVHNVIQSPLDFFSYEDMWLSKA